MMPVRKIITYKDLKKHKDFGIHETHQRMQIRWDKHTTGGQNPD